LFFFIAGDNDIGLVHIFLYIFIIQEYITVGLPVHVYSEEKKNIDEIVTDAPSDF